MIRKHSPLPILLLCFPVLMQATTLYVDLSLSSQCIGTYDPSTRSCGSGTEIAYHTLSTGLEATSPGDTLLLREGLYGQLIPPNSGTSENPITIRNYPEENAQVANLSSSVAISMDFRSHLTVDGLSFSNVRGFGHIYDSNHIVIQNCLFDESGVGTTGSMKVVRSTDCRFLNNSFNNGDGDVMVLQDAADRNLVEGNTFTTAHHSLLSIRCSEFNIIRGNTFDNPDQKAVEIYDCEGTSDAPYRLDSTSYNLFENNTFVRTRADTDDHSYNAIQHAGQHTIVRHNVVYNCLGGGFSYQHYSDEALYNYSNRMYNNTFYDNRCHAIIGSDPNDPTRYFDNRVTNNLLYLNEDCDGGGDQIRIPDPTAVILTNNALAVTDPHFVDEDGFDFRLQATSPHLNTGAFITATASTGSGTTLPVDDAGVFFDGFGATDEVGDSIQLEGQKERSRIVSIDYGTNLLTLDAPLTWTVGQGVHLAYGGSAPEMGAFEFNLQGEPLFADGFESGSTTAWSDTAP